MNSSKVKVQILSFFLNLIFKYFISTELQRPTAIHKNDHGSNELEKQGQEISPIFRSLLRSRTNFESFNADMEKKSKFCDS